MGRRDLDRQQRWQAQASYLATIREIREILWTSHLLTGKLEYRARLAEIARIEAKTLAELASTDREALVSSLWLDQRWAWKDTTKALKLDGELRRAVELDNWSRIGSDALKAIFGGLVGEVGFEDEDE